MPFRKAAKQREELEFRIFNYLARRPESSQRAIARHTEASLGAVNCCLRELVADDLLDVRALGGTPSTSGYAYVLTSKGLDRRAILSTRLIHRLRAECGMMLQELDDLLAEFPDAAAHEPDVKR